MERVEIHRYIVVSRWSIGRPVYRVVDDAETGVGTVRGTYDRGAATRFSRKAADAVVASLLHGAPEIVGESIEVEEVT